MNKKQFEIIANIFFWILTAWLISSSFSIVQHEIEIVNSVETITIKRNNQIIIQLLLLILISMVMFYFNLILILRLKKNKKLIHIISISLLTFLLAISFPYFLGSSIDYLNHPFLPTYITLGIVTFYYTISTSYGIGKVWQYSENQRQKLILKNKQAELSLLRSQLHPHFLFNTLNNLLAIIDQKQNPILANSLDRLSGLLRYVVYDIAHGKVSVEKEIDFIKNYAELQSLRFEQDEVDFNLQILGKNNNQLIEPGIFIPVIENAFKYGIKLENKSSIKVKFDLTNKSVVAFSITNIIHQELKRLTGNASGIKQTKERLELVYPNKHKLKIHQNNLFIVELKIETD